ncbi:TAXI family TRAP transporter solute-binding subunit [Pseudomonas sp.]|jgi:TRAP transporter TAXI family solute receptor|uniref:TAXI family TRAP transporter solute-binding subunit n=1 Tax=Pseudomonas sp. TaxID=306 RepID=UPI00272AEF20|nr:TAXI family TRAP transporter solute-binding subunit [Pseudomonas sp.]
MRTLFRRLAFATGLLLGSSATAIANNADLPRVMVWTAYGTGAAGYAQAAALGGLLKFEAGSNIRILPGRNDVSRMIPLKTGRADYCLCGIASYFGQEGIFLFNKPDWGPQPIRMVLASQGTQSFGLAAAADTGLKHPSELRGQSVVFIRGADSINMITSAVLAYGGLTWADVRRVDASGTNEAIEAIINGHADVMPMSTRTPLMERIAASPRGISWLAMPNETEEEQAAWERAKQVIPYYLPQFETRGAGVSEANPWHGGGYALPILVTNANRSADEVYALTRFVDQHYDTFKDLAPGAEGWELSRQVFDWVMPYHEGAIRYFREAGYWTDKHEAHNAQLLRRQEILAEAWAQQLAEAGGSGEFQRSWMERRARALVAEGFDPGFKR